MVAVCVPRGDIEGADVHGATSGFGHRISIAAACIIAPSSTVTFPCWLEISGTVSVIGEIAPEEQERVDHASEVDSMQEYPL